MASCRKCYKKCVINATGRLTMSHKIIPNFAKSKMILKKQNYEDSNKVFNDDDCHVGNEC